MQGGGSWEEGGKRFGGKTGDDDRRRLDLGLLAFDSYLLSIIYFK